MLKTLREEFPSVLDIAYGEYMHTNHISTIMSAKVKIIEGNRSMLDAASIMGEYHIGSLLVKGPERPSGIVTERDFITQVIAANKDPKKVKVLDVMTPRLITIRPQVTIREAAKTMIKEKGKLVVVEGRNLVGIVTASDLIKCMPEAPEMSVPVSKFMTKEVVSTSPNNSVLEVAKMMGKERIGSVIVNRKNEPWGIFTERDLLSKVIYKQEKLEKAIGEFSSSPLITIKPGFSIHKAARVMVEKHVRRLPVMEDSRLAGIITARDLVEAYAA
jgi:CBS domain-containing protein